MRMEESTVSERKGQLVVAGNRWEKLQKCLLKLSFLNLFLVSCLGVLLRSFPFISSFPLSYKNILHGHSHFAFGGWVMPVLLALVIRNFSQLRIAVGFKHWRNISVLMLVSAYGMLLSFPLQGYKAVSIAFSTISLASGLYWAIITWKKSRSILPGLSQKFLNAALFYHVLSSIGPFATAPLIVLGKSGTPLYFDVIYFFLHFQYNGLFTFTVLALIYKMLERQEKVSKNGEKVFWLFHLACIPTYFLSVLWHGPSLIFNIIGGAGAVLQLVGLWFLVKDARQIEWKQRFTQYLFSLSVFSFILKNILQFLGAFPLIAAVSYTYRNSIIAYLHLVLLGFISIFSFASVLETFSIRVDKEIRISISLFILAFISTEMLLVLSAAAGMGNFTIPDSPLMLLVFSCLFPLGLGSLYLKIKNPPRSRFRNP